MRSSVTKTLFASWRGWASACVVSMLACTFDSTSFGQRDDGVASEADTGTSSLTGGSSDAGVDCEPGLPGCPCEGDACAPECTTEACELPRCGDAMLGDDEQCDDGNEIGGDGCELDCTFSRGARQVAAGGRHTCAVTHAGAVRCWGLGRGGRLGLGRTDDVGDDEPASAVPDLLLGASIVEVSAGGRSSCARTGDGDVMCWGRGDDGVLGYGDEATIGDDETPADAGALELGQKAVQISVGRAHACALLEDRSIVCWGRGSRGRLGYGSRRNIGDDETPASQGAVELGARALQVAAGGRHTCAVLEEGIVRCWGFGEHGRLGLASLDDVGDDELPSSVALVNLGAPADEVVAGREHSCALLDTGEVRCWGRNAGGRLGRDHGQDIGDDEDPASVPAVSLPAPALDISATADHTCALSESGTVTCWGAGAGGKLGHGSTLPIGAENAPQPLPNVSVGEPVLGIDAGGSHTCVWLVGGRVRCWGAAEFGQLGHGTTEPIGDDELPSAAEDVPWLP